MTAKWQLDGYLVAYAVVCLPLAVGCLLARAGSLEVLAIVSMLCLLLLLVLGGLAALRVVRCRPRPYLLALGASCLWLFSTLNHVPI
jgi:hypothetical protein